MTTRCRASAILLLATLAGLLHGESPLPRPLSEVGFDQRLGEQVPLDLLFTDEAGRPVKLRDCFRQQPGILVLTDYRCASLSTLVHNALIQGLHEVRLVPGRDFQVVMVSFDPRETCTRAAAKKKVHLTHLGRPGAAEGWHCLTGTGEAIAVLAQAVGFRCHWEPQQQQFIHTAGMVLLTPDGKVSRYFYDIYCPAAALQQGLIEASTGRIGLRATESPRYCFHYDPCVGQHTATVLTLARVLGALAVVGVIALVGVLVRWDPRKTTRQSEKGIPMQALAHGAAAPLKNTPGGEP